jgi:ribosomal protein S17E
MRQHLNTIQHINEKEVRNGIGEYTTGELKNVDWNRKKCVKEKTQLLVLILKVEI